MPKNANEKIKLILIWQMLKQDSDEDHPLSTSDIINKLYEKGYSAERKAIYDAVKLLNENGFEVLSYRDTQNKYYVVDRSFDIAELKILLDAIQAASFITEKKTEIFIDKIAALAGSNRAKLLKKNIVCFDTAKHSNENIYYNIDTIDNCILANKKVSFQYFDFGINGIRIYRKDSERYIVNPVALVFSEDKYYLVCYNDKYKNLSNYRVDRMDKVEQELNDIDPAECVKGFNVHKHKKQAFSMYGGELVDVELQIQNDIIDVVVDKFGENIKMKKIDETHSILKARVQISPTFFSWCFNLGSKLKILSPDNVVKNYIDLIKESMTFYN